MWRNIIKWLGAITRIGAHLKQFEEHHDHDVELHIIYKKKAVPEPKKWWQK